MEIYDTLTKNCKLCIVSKKRSHDEILKYYNLGHRIFAENKAQELLSKVNIKDDIKWHFIGHLQTNKVKSIIKYVDCIQSVDSIHLLKEINKQAKKINKVVNVLIQFNIANETNKFGLKPDIAFDFFNQAIQFENVNIKGIMLMGPNVEDKNKIEEVFIQGKILFDNLKQKYPFIDTLSMGMSNDYEIALKNGSTMLRIGSLLF